MILELNGTKVTIVDKTLGYQGDNLVDTIQVTVDKDSTWNYKLDMYKGKSKCFDSVLMTREGNICTVQLTNEILSYGGRYIFQLRGYTDTQTYHSDIFESWVNASIEYQDDCKQTDCGCDCKLPTEFYQVEDNVTEINNHPPYPGDNGKWMIWDVGKHEYVESDIDVVGGGGGDYQTKANLTTSITAESTDEQYPSAKATYDYGQSIAQSAGKINAITVNGTPQTVEDKTAKIIVNKSTVGLGNVNNTSDNDKPVSSAQASAIADAKQAGTDAQANLTAHINDKENPHEVTKAQVGLGNVNNTSDVNKPISTATQTALNGKLDKTAVVDVTVEATKGQAADAKSVYDTIQALPTGTDISLGLTGANVGDIIKVKAVDASGKPTAWEAATSASDWTKIGELTMGGTTFAISAYADGVITVTPNDGVYPTVGVTRLLRKNDGSTYVQVVLTAAETEGQYTMSWDYNTYAPTDVDLTQYVVEEPEADILTFSNIPAFSYHKARFTAPYMGARGMRGSFASSYSGLNVYNQYAYNIGQKGVEIILENSESYSSDKINVKASYYCGAAGGGTYNQVRTINKPATPTSIQFYSKSSMLAIGSKVELWGRN